MKALGRRLHRAEAVLRLPQGCAVCRRWDGHVVGDESGKRSGPEVCPERGRGVPVRTVAVAAGLDQL